ncbi:MAG TPA: ferrochelatase [Pyrinomonadaceae bacterium]|jgi:ferrochelatase
MNQTSDSAPQTPAYDALLIVSFGGPEGMNDVIPFLENVLRGRNVPRERLIQVAKRYELFGGVSPINEQNRKLIAALKKELDTEGPNLPIYWGNRNWHPLLADTVQQMTGDGIRHAIAFVTSAYNSYSSCRQYMEDIDRARASAGADAPRIDKLRAFYNHPGFIEANIENVRAALEAIPRERRANTKIVFTAHSIPVSMAEHCEYEAQLQEASHLVAKGVENRDKPHPYKLVFQSRSGPPAQPWLGPDVYDYLKELKAAGTTDVVISPIGFVSDHMEIVYDLDTEARALCVELGMNMIRAATVGTHPAFIRMIRELIMERMDPAMPRRFMGTRGPAHAVCPPNCCLRGT